jgi:alanine racemase
LKYRNWDIEALGADAELSPITSQAEAPSMQRPVWAEIDLDALCSNVREIRRITNPRARVMAIVKANAYGHGVEQVSRVALRSGADWLGVALLQEALELRRQGISAPILILGHTPDEDAPEVVANDISQTVFTREAILALDAAAGKLGLKARVHVKIETGMGRIGFPATRETAALISQLAGLPNVEIEGIYTHFAAADAPDKSYAGQQFMKLQQTVKHLEAEGVYIRWRHCANSPAIINLPQTHLDLVRPGIILYGLYPSAAVPHDLITLRPVMSLKARVSFVKDMAAGASISYGCTYKTECPTRIATIPIGYADGYSRLLSNKAEVLIRGRRAPVAGRVCMDMVMVDVGQIPGVEAGDEVVLIGRQGAEEITADELADHIGTINYEVVTRIGERVPRLYVGTAADS